MISMGGISVREDYAKRVDEIISKKLDELVGWIPLKAKHETGYTLGMNYERGRQVLQTRSKLPPSYDAWSKWREYDKGIEYKGKLYYDKISRDLVAHVLESRDLQSGEIHTYKNIRDVGDFNIRDNKVYYVKNQCLQSIDLENEEETIVCNSAYRSSEPRTIIGKQGNDPYVAGQAAVCRAPIIGMQGQCLFATNGITELRTEERIEIDALLGFNEAYIYYQRGREIIQLEISTFTEKSFSKVFVKEKNKEVLFVDCTNDIVFYKENEKEPVENTRLLGYNFEDQVEVTLEIPETL